MLHRFRILCFIVVALVGLVNGSWWRDAGKHGGKPFFRTSTEKESTVKRQENVLNEEKCHCVPQIQCNNRTRLIATNGEGLFDFKSGKQCTRANEVCCFLPEDVPPGWAATDHPTTDEDVTDFTEVVTDEVDVNFDKDPEEKDDDEKEPIQTPVARNITKGTTGGLSSFFVCGHTSDPNIELKVAGDPDDVETRPGNFPWTLVLKYNIDTIQVLLCGASLILPSVALTAAHCLERKERQNILVRAGDWDLESDDNEPIFPQERRVKEIVFHPKYDIITIKNDIAILFLDEPFENSKTVNTICMPPIGEKVRWAKCYATGWGADGDGKLPTGDQTMKKARLPIVSRNKCEKALQKTQLGAKFKLHKSFMCAGGESSTDTCKGDGGGPLACQTNTPPYKFHLVGITSWGVGCAKKDVPGVYVDVTEMSSWIGTAITEAIESGVIPEQ